MCFGGGGAKPPEVIYSGPDPAQLAASNRALADYRGQVEQQQTQFAAQLDKQIADAQAETARIQAQYDEELDAQAAKALQAGNQEVNDAYVVTATQTPATGAETTSVIKPKKKNKRSLKIAAGNTANQAGSGLNIGV